MTTIIFVGGTSRSGTTYLAHALARFENISTGVESQWLTELITADLNTSEWVNFVQNHWKVRTSPRQPTIEQWEELNIIAANGDLGKFCERLLLYLAKDNVDFIVDHTPGNIINHPELKENFPNAKFIHIVRDGRAVFSSLKNVKWGPNTPIEAANFWLRFIAHGLLAERNLDSQIFRQVKYESLLADPNEILNTVGWALGESGTIVEGTASSPKIKAQTKTEVPRHTKGQHAMVNDAPNVNRIDAWKSTLSISEIAAFESRAHTLLTHFGYDIEHYPKKIPGRGYIAKMQIKEVIVGVIINPIRNAIRTRGAQYR